MIPAAECIHFLQRMEDILEQWVVKSRAKSLVTVYPFQDLGRYGWVRARKVLKRWDGP